MAREAKEKTDAQKKVLDLRNKLAKANEAHEKSTDKAKSQKVIDDLKAQLAPAVQAENRERFVSMAGARVKKIRVAMRNLRSINNLRSYHFDESDVAKVESVLALSLKETLTAMRAAFTKGAAVKSEDDISFD